MLPVTKWHRECVRLAQDFGITDIHIKPGGKHAKLLGRIGDTQVILILHTGTIADRGCQKKKFCADIRRLLRQHKETAYTAT
jgi:hypothetical protein